jgi:Flp pilus assembly pilin Flp
MPHWSTELQRLARDEGGQDLVEYAFLTFFVALASAAVFLTLQAAIGTAYATSSAGVYVLWQPPDPKLP